MNKVAANIVKGMVGRLQGNGAQSKKGELTWLQKKVIKHQEDELIKWHHFQNFKMAYKRPYEFLHTYHDIFEKEIYRFTTGVNNPLILDCGANIGFSVQYFKQLYPAAKVIVFEPDENNFKLLQLNGAANGWSNTELHKAAVWVHNDHISFSSQQSEASHVTDDETGATKVPCVRLYDILKAHHKVHFLKMDIEGAEYKVLQDVANELHKVDNFFLEYHGKAEEAYKLADILEILKKAEFSVYIKNAADALAQPFVQKSTAAIYDVQLNLFCYRSL